MPEENDILDNLGVEQRTGTVGSPPEDIRGCTDETASNYNPNATVSDPEAPCKYEKTLNLKKQIFGQKNFKENIDTEFSEFLVQDYSIPDFFALYNQLFYDIPIRGFFSHETIVLKSLNYIGEYTHPRSENIDSLYEQLQAALERLNSIEEEHEIVKNNTLLVEKDSSPPKYYWMQTFKKRRLTGPVSKIVSKIREIKGMPANSDIEVPLSQEALALIPDGPDVGWSEDIGFSVLQVNLVGVDIYDKRYLIDTYGSGASGISHNVALQDNILLY